MESCRIPHRTEVIGSLEVGNTRFEQRLTLPDRVRLDPDNREFAQKSACRSPGLQASSFFADFCEGYFDRTIRFLV